ncbi:alkaline phosphatase D family protein [Colwellia sp. E2M01]|uniref:alkaline phosphatase D family protein n=1 Tax=Colwellia sp. E2M01 TaxID=2841561 RepID=UPI001C08FEE2|nr:alkaline phosphatase D family protein [Colwellia sp. E2M01]MBU2871115.1 alkaline phosphatase D family protein [Colwellia sp. E2M01]
MTRIAFASCCRYESFPHIPHNLKQAEWRVVADTNPDYLFLLGDQIYMDYGLRFFSQEYIRSPEKLTIDQFEAKMDAKYSQQFSVPHFNNLITKMREKNALFATWDDHDFAWDNALGSDVPDDKKAVSTRLFKQWVLGQEKPDDKPIYRYVDLPKDNPVARFIILDNRSYSNKKSMLGETQMAFLLEKMQHKLAHTFVCSSLTLTQGGEDWSNFSDEYALFCQAVHASEPNVFFVAGDIHKNKLLEPNKKRPCYEIISSGISVNYLALPFSFDDRHNWGSIEFDENSVTVELHKVKVSNLGEIKETECTRSTLSLLNTG